MMERIKKIWTQLETSDTAVSGLFKLRYSETSECDVFLGVKYPEKNRIFIIRTPFTIGKDFRFKYELKGLIFEKIYDPENPKFILLNLVLVDEHSKDIFDTLISDVIAAVIYESDIKIILKNYSNRLIKWQSLFEQSKQQGLSSEQQRGLFGELYFIREMLNNNLDSIKIVNSWVGSEKQVRDFQLGYWAVEVKTTHSNNHQRIQISSERQLDITNVKYLFLYHLSLEAQQKSGESLNDIVNYIYTALINDSIALNNFKIKLLQAGYFDQHSFLYEETGYHIRKSSFYQVQNDFPRIEERSLPSGVGDVKYSIILSKCMEYVVEDSFVFKTIIANDQ